MDLFSNNHQEWLTLRTRGIELSNSEVKFVVSTFRPLFDQAPSNSHFIFTLTANGRVMKGALNINSELQTFTSETYSSNVFRTCTEIKKDIQRKMNFWRDSKRFQLSGPITQRM